MKFAALIIFLALNSLTLASDSKVLLHLLDHTGKSKEKNTFWIDWSDTNIAITKSVLLKGKEAEAVIETITANLSSKGSGNACGHSPIYGIVATNSDGKTLRTSLCFKCMTWVKPKLRLSIKGDNGINNPLCKLLRKHIELPNDLLEPEVTPKR